MVDPEAQSVRKVIEEAYLRGIHGSRSPDLIAAGFHPDFRMLVRSGERLEQVDVPTWLARIEKMQQAHPEAWEGPTTAHFRHIGIAGCAAAAILDVEKGGRPFSMDAFLLYRFEVGWRIVSKAFSIPT